MFFFRSKSKAERLIAKFNKTVKGRRGAPMDQMARYRQALEELKTWGTQHPEEFVPLLNAENAAFLGDWIAGSGARGVELLRALILGPDLDKAAMAVHALWGFEAAAASEVGLMTELLGHADARMRSNAAQCLARIGPDAVSAGPELVRLAQEGGPEESRPAFYALEKIGYDPAIAAQVCYDAIASGSAGRFRAMRTLDAIGADPTPVLDGILASVGDDTDRESRLLPPAAKLLRKCDLSDADTRRRVVQALERLAEQRMQTEYVSLLWELDPGNGAAIRRIDAGLRSDNWEMEAACDVICGAKEGGVFFVPLLIEKLETKQDHWDFCWAAVDALGEIGPAAIAAKGTLERLTNHSSGLVQERAKEALRKIDG